MAPSQPTVEQLKQQLAEAHAQLAQVKLQNTASEAMITVAEKQLNIEIRKKVWFQTVQKLNVQYPLTGSGKLCGLREKIPAGLL